MSLVAMLISYLIGQQPLHYQLSRDRLVGWFIYHEETPYSGRIYKFILCTLNILGRWGCIWTSPLSPYHTYSSFFQASTIFYFFFPQGEEWRFDPISTSFSSWLAM